jgi:predicted TIM-barrel fold metal-dependent hydrolase
MADLSRRTFLGAAALTASSSASGAAEYRILDPHVHTWRHDPEFPFAQGANVPARDATPETLLDLMNANGVSRTVIIQVSHYLNDNRFLTQVLKQYPQIFKGVCRVDPSIPSVKPDISNTLRFGLS